MAVQLKDPVLHGIAAVIIGVVGLCYPWLTAVLQIVFWGVREIVQDYNKGHRPTWPIRRSLQKDAEFIVPAIFAIVTAIAITLARS